MVTRIVGVNMLRVLLYTALALNFSALAVTATDRYGGWLLEQQRSYVHLCHSNNRSNSTITSELGYICDQRKNKKSVGLILIPFDGTFQSDGAVACSRVWPGKPHGFAFAAWLCKRAVFVAAHC